MQSFSFHTILIGVSLCLSLTHSLTHSQVGECAEELFFTKAGTPDPVRHAWNAPQAQWDIEAAAWQVSD